MTVEHDSKRIVRQWNREIEEETRSLAAEADQGPWRGLVWGALWLFWLLLLGGLFGAVPLRG